MSETATAAVSNPEELQRNQKLLSMADFCRLEGITDRAFKKRRSKGRLTVMSGPIGRNGKPVPMISIDQLSQAGLTRWVGEQTAKHQAALAATQTHVQGGTVIDRRQLDRREMDRDRAALWDYYEHRPQGMKDEAARRVVALQTVEKLTASGIGRVKAIDTVGKEIGESRVTLYRWFDLVKGIETHNRLAALVPRYAGCLVEKEISPDAFELFCQDYLRVEKPSAAGCYERLCDENQRNGHQWAIPTTVATLMKRLEETYTPQEIIFAREGLQGLQATLLRQVRDHSVFSVMEAVCSDAYEARVRCHWPDGHIGRPWVCGWQDVKSNYVFPLRTDKVECSELVLLAFAELLKWGVPKLAYLDNGRSYASKAVTGGTPNRYRFKVKPGDPNGVLTMLGVEVAWCKPRGAWAKPVERAWRDFRDRLDRHPALRGAYVGGPTEKNVATKTVPVELFKEVLAEVTQKHNERPKRRSAVCRGFLSFRQVFEEEYQKVTVAKLTDEQRKVALLAAQVCAVSGRDGAVWLYRNRFWDEALCQFIGKPQQERQVLARFDPDRFCQEGVYLYDRDGRFLVKAACVAPVGFRSREAGKEWQKLQGRQAKRAMEAVRDERRMDVLSAYDPQLPPQEISVPDAHVVIGQFGDLPIAVGDGRERKAGEEPTDERFGKAVELMRQEFERKMAGRI